ncbi:unnamed protein product [Amoebophrya sp. A120]|nr:unnamed protein product [Amoebophrya sp. A120]|eukprot:GSA120T00021398001.1
MAPAAATPAAVFDVTKKPEPYKDRGYRILELPNKLKLVLISDKKCDKAAVAVSVKVGSLCEKPYKTDGLAHFLEHMLFLGTEKYPEEESYKKFLSKNGGGCNASTSDDWTRYHLYVKPEQLDEAVDRISQFFLQPLLDENCTDREMHAVDSEHSKNLQNEARRALQVFRNEADVSHPLNHFRTGNLETLQKDSIREILLNFHKDYYSANLMGVAILGRESLEELEKMAVGGMKTSTPATSDAPLIVSPPQEKKSPDKDAVVAPNPSNLRFAAVENKDVALPEFPYAFGHYAKNRVAKIAKHIILPESTNQGLTSTTTSANYGTSSTTSSPSSSSSRTMPNLPVATLIEPVKEERYFAFQFFTPEQDRLFWREKTDSFWSHVLGYEGPGSLLSFLKEKNLCTSLSAGMYYDGGGTGVFQIRVSLTKEFAESGFELKQIGELVFKYLVMLKKDLILNNFAAGTRTTEPSSEGTNGSTTSSPTSGTSSKNSIIRRIWEEKRDLAELRFKYRPLPDPVDSVLTASRNVLLYPKEELLSGSTLLYEDRYNEREICEFFEFFRLDNLRLVVFHENSCAADYLYNNDSAAAAAATSTSTGGAEVLAPTSEMSKGADHNKTELEPFFRVKYKKPQALHPVLLSQWAKVDKVLDQLALLQQFNSYGGNKAKQEITNQTSSAKLALEVKKSIAFLEIPEAFFVMKPNLFIPVDFELKKTVNFNDNAAKNGIEKFCDVVPFHQGVGQERQRAVGASKAFADDVHSLYRKKEVAISSSSTPTRNRILFKPTLFPYDEPRIYLKINLYSDFVAESLHNYCLTLFTVQTILEYLNEVFYDCEISGLDYDIVTHSFGGLTIFCGGYSDKLFVLLEELLKNFMTVLGEDERTKETAVKISAEDKKSSPDTKKLESSLQILIQRKLKTWFNSAFKKQPLEVASCTVDESIAMNDYPMEDMYEWLLKMTNGGRTSTRISSSSGEVVDQPCALTLDALRTCFANLFQNTKTRNASSSSDRRPLIAEGLVEGNLSADAIARVHGILEKNLPFLYNNKTTDPTEGRDKRSPTGCKRKAKEQEQQSPAKGLVPSEDYTVLVPGFKKGVKLVEKDSKIVKKSPNANDPNSATVMYIQTGNYCLTKPESRSEAEISKVIQTRALNMLLAQLFAQPFFADLRTKQQLGYLVSARADFVNGMTGMQFRVQSSHTNCAEIEQRILTFFNNFREEVLLSRYHVSAPCQATIDSNFFYNMTDNPTSSTTAGGDHATTINSNTTTSEWQQFLNGVCSKLEEKPKKLAQEFSAHWGEVSFRSFNFSWKLKAIEFLKALPFETFLDYYDTVVAKAPKLWVHCLGPNDDSWKVGEAGSSAAGAVEIGEELFLSEQYQQFVNNVV